MPTKMEPQKNVNQAVDRKNKVILKAFLKWLVRSVLSSGLTFFMFLVFHGIYGKAAGSELVEFGSLVFGVSWQEFLEGRPCGKLCDFAEMFFKFSFMIFGFFYALAYRSAYTGIPLTKREDVTFAFMILIFGGITMSLCACLAVYREVRSNAD